MRKEIFMWAVLSLAFSLIMGGRPWPFPKSGRFWLRGLRTHPNHIPKKDHSDQDFHPGAQTVNE